MRHSSSAARFLIVLLFVLSLRLFVASHFQSQAWVDEVWAVTNPGYQIFSGMFERLGSPGSVFDYKNIALRSFFPPVLFSMILKAFSFFGISAPGTMVFSARFLSSLLSIGVFAGFFYLLRGWRVWPVLLIFGLIPDLIHYATTFDLSVLALPFLVSSFVFSICGERKNKGSFLIFEAASMGLAVLLRSQLVLFAGIRFFDFVLKKRFRGAASYFFIGTFFLAFDAFFNSCFYGKAVFPFFTYFNENASGLAASYGVSPFYVGIEYLWRQMTEPVFLIAVFFSARSIRTFKWISVSVLAYFFIHCLIGHKEYRFFYPASALLAALALLSFFDWCSELKPRVQRLAWGLFVPVFLGTAVYRGFYKTGFSDFQIPARLVTYAGGLSDIKGLVVFGWGGIFDSGQFPFFRDLPRVHEPTLELLRKRGLNPSAFSHVIAPSSFPAPCFDRIREEGGATLFKCSASELRALFQNDG